MYFVIGKDECPYCDKAKSILDKTKQPYVYKNLSIMPTVKVNLWKEIIKNELNMTTVPVVVNLIGGFQELEKEINSND